jgi:hypothetical protein
MLEFAGATVTAVPDRAQAVVEYLMYHYAGGHKPEWYDMITWLGMNDSRYEVRNAEVEVLLRDIGKIIGNRLPEGWGFTLLLFSFGEGGDLFYISNAQRDDMIRCMREFIAKQEGSNGA